ncbi:MAG: hypothetical protein ACXAB7_09000 [Candidatus Kariarchaeaceae archaeon]|jgi:hypothetical protein
MALEGYKPVRPTKDDDYNVIYSKDDFHSAFYHDKERGEFQSYAQMMGEN